MRIEKLRSLCASYRVISFDIFDTLLKRDVPCPSDVFELMEHRLSLEGFGAAAGFAQNRRAAERAAREQSKYDEVTLDEIYEELDCSETDRRRLKELELDVERDMLLPNPRIKEIYDKCLAEHKRIYIVSDMYLPRSFLEEVLKMAGYAGYTKLFLSCEYRKTKRSGELFKALCEEEHLNSKEILHIGDSRYADCIGPAKQGIRGVRIERHVKNVLYQKAPDGTEPLDQKYLYAFINNRLPKMQRRAEKLGYEVLGPIIYGYCQWLHRTIEGKNAKVWFAARDMYLFVEAYREMYGEDERCEYIYISRKSLRPVYTDAVGDLSKAGEAFARGKYSISQIIEYMGYSLDDAELPRGVDIDAKEYDARKLGQYEELRGILSSPRIVQTEREICRLGYEYLEDRGLFDNDIVLADVGWHGTTQYLLHNIQNSKTSIHGIEGCYIGCLDGTDEKIGRENYKVFLFDEHDDCMFEKGIILLESMILAPHGSAIGYDVNDGVVFPVLGQAENASKLILDIQSGAKEFIRDFCERNGKEYIALSSGSVKKAFENLTQSPQKEELTAIGELQYENFYCSKMAAPKSLVHYILHPGVFLNDLKYSPWRIGFLYRLFKLRLPYAKIYSTIRRRQGKLS